MKPARAKPRKPEHPRKHGLKAVEPNLVITIDERHRPLAEYEVQSILKNLGIKGKITGSPGQGLVGVYVQQDPRQCIGQMRSMLSKDPLAFQHTHRWVPIEEWAAAEAKEVARFGKRARAEIGSDESWGIKAERHSSRAEPETLITALARDIDNKNVDLEAPDKTVLLEIVGKRAGFAVVEKDQVLSVDHEMKEFVRFEELE